MIGYQGKGIITTFFDPGLCCITKQVLHGSNADSLSTPLAVGLNLYSYSSVICSVKMLKLGIECLSP